MSRYKLHQTIHKLIPQLNQKYGLKLEVKNLSEKKFEVELMQFTGFFDRNLVEVFESDIFSGNLTAGLTTRNYIVVFVPGAFMFQDGDKLYHIKTEDFLYLDKIGNKFENPELLK
jgi:hypothetical protein